MSTALDPEPSLDEPPPCPRRRRRRRWLIAGARGTWAVDTSIGTFSYDDSTGTCVGFRIAEELAGIGSTTAVGRSPDVAGTITIDGAALTAASIEADMSAITTNDSRRNHEVQEALETSTYPTATVTAVGDLTIHGVTTRVSVPTAPIVLSAADQGVVELQLFFTKG